MPTDCTPLFSVIMPLHNAGDTVADALASVQAQTCGAWEIRVVNDRSTDDGPDIVAAMARNDPRILLSSLAEGWGAAAARNAAIRQASGRYIAFLDSDDLWMPDKLARQLAMFRAGAFLVYGGYERMTEAGQTLRTVRVPAQVTYEDALRGNPIGCLTAAFDSTVCGRAEMPMLDRRQDYALWLRLLREHGAAHGDTAILGRYRVRAGSLSSNRIAAALDTWHVLRRVEGLPLRRALPAFAHYARSAVAKRL